MKYKLPRQVINPEINRVISREIRKQKIKVPRVTKKNLIEIAEVSKVIQSNGLPKNLVCKKLPNNIGYGIFLRPDAKPILKGEIIAPYSGEVSIVAQSFLEDGSYAFTPIENILLTKQEQKHFDPKRKYHPKRHYMMVIDAQKKGNFTRFINHSAKPNVIAYTLSTPSNPHHVAPAKIEIIYQAKKKINPGEQLLVSYEDGEESYWGVMKIKPFLMTAKTFQINDKLQLVGPI